MQRIFTYILLALLTVSANAQSFLQINSSDEVEINSLLPHIKIYETANQISPEEAYNKLNFSNKAYTPKKNSFGYSKNYFWIYFKTINLSPNQLTPYLIINNPLLDTVQIWSKSPEGIVTPMALAGDAVDFSVRPVPSPKIVFELPLKPFTPEEYIICVNKRFSSVAIPIKMASKTTFWEEEKADLLFYSLYFGCLVAIVCYVLILFFRTRLSVFIWYVLYLVFIGLYLLSEIGLTGQFITVSVPFLNNYAKPVTISIASVALVQFIIKFLRVDRHYPWFAKLFNIISGILLAATFYWVLTPQLAEIQTVYFLTIQNILIFSCLVLVIVASIMCYRKDPVIVSFFMAAFLAVLLAGLSIIVTEFGWIKKGVLNTNPLFVGSLIEITMLAAGLGVWYRNLQKEHQDLTNNLQTLKDDMYTSFISGIESRKQKFAFELHDNIGSRLSNLSRLVESEPINTQNLNSQLRELTQTARTLSHQLSPTPFSSVSFEETLHQLIGRISGYINSNLQVYIDPEQPFTHVQEDILKITRETLVVLDDLKQEMEVDVQFFVHPDEIVFGIDAEDYVSNDSSVTVYLKELIEARTKKLYGTLMFEASPDAGLSIMITIPN